MPRPLLQFEQRHTCGTLASAVTAEARPRWLVIIPSLSSKGTPALAQSIGITVRLRIALPADLPWY